MDNKNDLKTDELLLHTPIFDVLRRAEVEAGFKPIAVKAPDWVSVCVQKDGKWLVTKQLRFGTMRDVIEFPCGCVEEGEAPVFAAARELAEETGYAVDIRDIERLGSLATNPGFMTNKMHYFFVDLDAVPYKQQSLHLDEHEHLTTSWIDPSELESMFVEAGDSPALAAGMLYFLEKRHRSV